MKAVLIEERVMASIQVAREFTPRRKAGFTLVELLVVIGIIGVLISILLPSLSKARQQANLIACQSNLHQIGTLVNIYISENHGYLPYGHATMKWNNTDTLGAPSEYKVDMTPSWDWPDSLARLSRSQPPQGNSPPGADPVLFNISPTWGNNAVSIPAKNLQNMANDYPGIFHDYDGDGLGYDTRVSDYIANVRVFPDNNAVEIATFTPGNSNGGYLPLRSAASIKRSSEVMAIWCGASQIYGGALNGYNAVSPSGPLSWYLDQSAIAWMGAGTFSYGYIYPAPPTVIPAVYSNLISLWNLGPPGGASAATGLVHVTTQPGDVLHESLLDQNVDNPFGGGVQPYKLQGKYTCAMRYRHMGGAGKNAECNVLFADGHVESRVLGTVTAKDISLNYVAPGPPPLP
jgi:prepilin-type N-terminal cleavage/methylation domain-containing protein/prepilin-type processing-associated H-X9-DG protein